PSQQKPELRLNKDFEEKYNKFKAKLALFSSDTSSKSSMIKSKGLVAEAYEWDEEDVLSDDNDMTKVKVLMALADDENVVVGKESARNGEWVKISMRKAHTLLDMEDNDARKSFLVAITESSATEYDSTDESSVCSTPLPPLKKLANAEPVSRPKTIKLILKSNSIVKSNTLKGVTINKPSSAPARGNKNASASKNNSTPTGKLKNVKTDDDSPLSIVMKELNDLKLQISKNQSSYSRNNKSQQRTNHRTCDHAEYMSTMNMTRHLKSQGGSSLRSKTSRPSKPFPPCIHYGFNDHLSDDCVNYPICDICGCYDHDIHGHNRFRRDEALQAKKAEAFQSKKTKSSNANRSKTPTKRIFDCLTSWIRRADTPYLLCWIRHDNITIAESERYPPDEYLHPYEPSQRYQVNSNVVSFIDPYERLEPIVLETNVSSDQHDQADQNDHSAQDDEILNDDQSEHSKHTSDNHIIDNLSNTKDVQTSEPLSSPDEDASVSNTIPILTNPSLSIPSLASPAPQDRWSQDKHIELVNIIGNPGAGMLTRAMAKEQSTVSAHECLFVDFLSEEEPKKVTKALKNLGWVDAMQEELN
ncbi:hypothetical protein Tco_0880013, partial [Tanacetum coccineum]